MKKASVVIIFLAILLFLTCSSVSYSFQPQPEPPGGKINEGIVHFEYELKSGYAKLETMKQGDDAFIVTFTSESVPSMQNIAQEIMENILLYEKNRRSSDKLTNIKNQLNSMQTILKDMLNPNYRYDKKILLGRLNEVRNIFNQVKIGISSLLGEIPLKRLPKATQPLD